MGDAKWALSFLLDKLEMTFSEELIQLIEKKALSVFLWDSDLRPDIAVN